MYELLQLFYHKILYMVDKHVEVQQTKQYDKSNVFILFYDEVPYIS
jgi:hypothetical protein